MALKKLIFNSFYFGSVVVLKELIFNIFYFGKCFYFVYIWCGGLEETDF